MRRKHPYFKHWIWALAVFGLTGCMSAADYRPPDTSKHMAERWHTDLLEGHTALDSGQQPMTAWWRRFNDEELSRLIGKLSGSSLTLAEARERILEAYARRGIARADAKLQVAASAGYTHAEAGDEAVSFQGPPPGSSADLFSAGAAAEWELDLWGRNKRLVEAADADIEAASADYRSMLVSLSAELALAYIDLRTLRTRMDMVRENISLQEKTLALAEKRLASGVGTALEVARTRHLLDSTRARIPELERGAGAARNRIDLLLGARPGETQLDPGSMPEMPELIGVGIPMDLMTRRPDISAGVLRYRAAVARTGAAKADKYPRLSLSGILNLQSDSLDGLFDPDSLIYSLGPGLHFPLFTGGRIESRIQQQVSRAEQARLALSRKIIEALSEVETAAIGVVRTQEQVRELRSAEVSALESVDLADALFRSGLGDMFQVLDAEKQQVSARESLLLARQRALSEVVRLYRALGGGWETEQTDGNGMTASVRAGAGPLQAFRTSEKNQRSER